MLLERVYDEDLAQASYFIGCQATGEAVVVDPRRDVRVYLEMARRNGMRIAAVTETHIHADYLSGSRELAAASGARLYLSDAGEEPWKYGFEGERLRDGDEIKVGNVSVQAVHTPGHTPEHLSFLITDGAASDEPGYILTGDFVFVGDLGRPDLLEEAAGMAGTREEGARRMFWSLRERFLALPDYVQVYPGHGSGSACGRALGAVPSSTVGYERRFAWWSRYVGSGDEEGFVEALLEGQPDAPAYFGRMKRQNREGPALLGELPELRRYESEELARLLRDGEALLIDTRSLDEYYRGAIPGAIVIPGGEHLATSAAWVIDPEEDQRDIVLLARDAEDAGRMRDHLVRVGIDNVRGYVTDTEGLPKHPVELVRPEELAAGNGNFVLDVRAKGEYRAGHIPGARQLHVGRVRWHLEELPEDRPIVVHCQSGRRAAIAASALRLEGLGRVLELEGSYEGWTRAHRKA
ncbi:Zn-dependent hydrolase [Rubrobacter xylanophilus]|uniref:Zn-dependent hydrolase n=1 Tax=Rubrobacter xylanophilus TaxID=49319 RepID=A0A510HGK0_9ACTN|nr:MBL fold metallo-hydrolase [Rubrobacter xylanophilus]BBL79102.1 Zn-dependent hydrolase [Rubrobacter xylanophilus]